MFVHASGDADATGVGQGLQPRRQIHPIAEEEGAIDGDVAEVDADSKQHLSPLREIERTLGQVVLNLDGRAHRLDRAGELRHDRIARTPSR